MSVVCVYAILIHGAILIVRLSFLIVTHVPSFHFFGLAVIAMSRCPDGFARPFYAIMSPIFFKPNKHTVPPVKFCTAERFQNIKRATVKP